MVDEHVNYNLVSKFLFFIDSLSTKEVGAKRHFVFLFSLHTAKYFPSLFLMFLQFHALFHKY